MRLDKVCRIYQFGHIGCLLSIEEDAKRIIWNLDQHGNFNRKPNREPHSRVSLYTAQSIHPLAAPTATKQWTRHRVEQLINACGKLFSPLSVQKKLLGVICTSEVSGGFAQRARSRMISMHFFRRSEKSSSFMVLQTNRPISRPL